MPIIFRVFLFKPSLPNNAEDAAVKAWTKTTLNLTHLMLGHRYEDAKSIE